MCSHLKVTVEWTSSEVSLLTVVHCRTQRDNASWSWLTAVRDHATSRGYSRYCRPRYIYIYIYIHWHNRCLSNTTFVHIRNQVPIYMDDSKRGGYSRGVTEYGPTEIRKWGTETLKPISLYVFKIQYAYIFICKTTKGLFTGVRPI